GFISGVAIEVGGRGQRAREEKSRVDGRQFALPGPATRFYVEKMIEEALIARCVGLRSLARLPQKSQSLSSNLGREFPNEDAALDDDGNARQSHSCRCDACWRGCLRLVAKKAIVRIAAVKIVQERRKLQQRQEVFVGGRSTKATPKNYCSTFERLGEMV